MQIGQLSGDLKSYIQVLSSKCLHLSNTLSPGLLVLITVGSEITATTLCSVTWFLLQNDDTMQKLKEEVRTRFQSEDEINLTNVAQLKYMLACLDEAMRLFPPAHTGNPRVVLKGRDMIAGQWVPEGVSLSFEFLSSCSFTLIRGFFLLYWI